MDREAIEAGTPGIVLMQRAAAALAKEIEHRAPGRDIVLLCGGGNNGGDGFAAANLLLKAGFAPKIVLYADPENLRGDAAIAYSNLESAVPVMQSPPESCDLIVDCLLGTGLDREVTGQMADAVAWINGASVPVVACDIPSGVDGRTGRVLGCAVKADVTVTFAVKKPGLLFYPGRTLAGEVFVADIGLPVPEDIWGEIDQNDLNRLLPARDPDSHKGTYGHLAVLAGSEGMMGAGAMASASALRTGAGLVSWAYRQGGIPRGIWEVMTRQIPQDGEAQALEAFLTGKNAAVVGPGLGKGSLPWVEAAMKAHIPLVVDADGLNGLLGEPGKLCGAQGVITPHPGEAARLLGCSIAEITAEPAAAAQQLAERTGMVACVKGAVTVIASPEGKIALNTAGNPGMATAGSGDVLSGIIGSLLAQGLTPWDAACCGVHLHALAGDYAAQKGMAGMIASDMIGALQTVLGSFGR